MRLGIESRESFSWSAVAPHRTQTNITREPTNRTNKTKRMMRNRTRMKMKTRLITQTRLTLTHHMNKRRRTQLAQK
jgi:hypothetical protein